MGHRQHIHKTQTQIHAPSQIHTHTMTIHSHVNRAKEHLTTMNSYMLRYLVLTATYATLRNTRN